MSPEGQRVYVCCVTRQVPLFRKMLHSHRAVKLFRSNSMKQFVVSHAKRYCRAATHSLQPVKAIAASSHQPCVGLCELQVSALIQLHIYKHKLLTLEFRHCYNIVLNFDSLWKKLLQAIDCKSECTRDDTWSEQISSLHHRSFPLQSAGAHPGSFHFCAASDAWKREEKRSWIEEHVW